MGRYRLGDIIRMTRKSLSITQDQLSEGICSVETLSRVESGKQNPSKDVYELLMERMGRIRERAYSMQSVSDFKVLELIRRYEQCIQDYNFHKADYILEDIVKKLGNTPLDRQFVIRAQSIVSYRLGRISSDDFLDELEKAIRITIPKYGYISLANWPLTYTETVLLLNISTAYSEQGKYYNGIRILEDMYSALKQSYMAEEQRVIMQVALLGNVSKWYGLIEEHEKAIDMAREGIDICRKFKIGNALPNLLYNYVWNKEQLIEKGVLLPENKRECISYLIKAYYIASAMQQPYVVDFINKHMTMYYDINLKF